MKWRQLVSSVLFQVKGWLLVRSGDRSNNKWRDTERGSETPSLDSVFRDPPWLLCSAPCLQVITAKKLLGALSNLKQVRGEIDEKVNEVRNRKKRRIVHVHKCVCVCQWAFMHGCMLGRDPCLKISITVSCHENKHNIDNVWWCSDALSGRHQQIFTVGL